jgi:DNA gyrase/topoisomerase IV subunit A
VLASSHGYGFVTRFENLTGATRPARPCSICPRWRQRAAAGGGGNPETDRIVAVTSAGHLLAFPVADLPELDKGKGNKLIEIPWTCSAPRKSSPGRISPARMTVRTTENRASSPPAGSIPDWSCSHGRRAAPQGASSA